MQTVETLNKLQYFPDLMQELAGKLGPATPQATEAPKVEAAKPVAAEPVKTKFNVELTAVDPTKKLNVIKEFKAMFGLGLKEAKDTVEKLPQELKSGIPKEEAEELKQKLEALGCTVLLK